MNLGAIKRPKDFRDIYLGKIQLPVSLPTSYKTDISKVTRIWQGPFGTCGAHAGAHAVAILKSLQTGNTEYLSPRYLWEQIKKIDGFSLDVGTDLRSILKTLSNWGICDYSMLPNDFTITLEQYSDSSNITDLMNQNAQTRVILPNYGFIDNPTVDELKQAIYQNKAVINLFRCDNGLFHTITPTFTTKKYGHFTVYFGFDDESQTFDFLDSCEEDNTFGIKQMKYSDVGFINEVGTLCEAPEGYVENLKNQVKYLQLILELYQKVASIFIKK